MTTPAPPEEHDPAKPDKSKEIVSPIPPEIFEKLPPKERQIIGQFMSSAMSFGPMPNPIAQKITSEHISKFIESQSETTKLGYSDQKDSRRFALMAFGIAAILSTTIIIVLALSNKTDILMELVKAGIFLGGGFGGGIGFSEYRRRKED